ncbi:hypothetical protein JTB14_023713 [Gonioctena quinquepunctata]|nr:hypothetical protein JTB14_023713 [Gonioctena quinquepunctata]
MVRNPKRKSTRASQPHDIVLREIKEVKQEKRSISTTAAKYIIIPFRSLARNCSKISEEELGTVESEKLIGYHPNRKAHESLTSPLEILRPCPKLLKGRMQKGITEREEQQLYRLILQSKTLWKRKNLLQKENVK